VNWRRGLFRLWIALTILWVGFVGVLLYETWPLERTEQTARVATSAEVAACKQRRSEDEHFANERPEIRELACSFTYDRKVAIDYQASVFYLLLIIMPPAFVLGLAHAARWSFRAPDTW
jgi:hypothetical protein